MDSTCIQWSLNLAVVLLLLLHHKIKQIACFQHGIWCALETTPTPLALWSHQSDGCPWRHGLLRRTGHELSMLPAWLLTDSRGQGLRCQDISLLSSQFMVRKVASSHSNRSSQVSALGILSQKDICWFLRQRKCCKRTLQLTIALFICLLSGLRMAMRINTLSETYAKQMQYKTF